MAKIKGSPKKVSLGGRFPKKPKGNPKVHYCKPPMAGARKGGGGNQAFSSKSGGFN